MSKFLDGPAAGVELLLRSAPTLLRVVRGARGEFEALDQPSDAARPGEAIYLYRRVSSPMRFHLCVRGRNRGASGWYESADYRLADLQLADEVLRDNAKFHAAIEAETRNTQCPQAG